MRAVGATTREIQRRIPYVLDLVGVDGQGAAAHPALRRGAAAGGHRPCPGQQPQRDHRRRAHRQPRPCPVLGNHASLLEKINDMGTTILVVTHERELVNRFGKRVVAIESGRIISDAAGGYYGNG